MSLSHKILLLAIVLLFNACTHFPQRTGYNRAIGDYDASSYYNPLIHKTENGSSRDNSAALTLSTSNKSTSNSQKSGSKSITTKNRPVDRGRVSGNKSLKAEIKPWLGTRYKWGGNTKKGVDCSGFVLAVMRSWKGIQLPRTSRAMWTIGSSVSKSNLRPGDLVFFGSWHKINHVGIYTGDGKFAHSSSSKGVIYTKLSNSYYVKRWRGARRLFD